MVLLFKSHGTVGMSQADVTAAGQDVYLASFNKATIIAIPSRHAMISASPARYGIISLTRSENGFLLLMP